ncbi:MAG: hypothetical protein SNJ62_13050, partial [Chloracidobacterium sp.]
MSATRQEAAMRQVFERVVADPDLHWATMNLYYYSEYHGAEGIAALAKRAESTNPQLAEELVHHRLQPDCGLRQRQRPTQRDRRQFQRT